MLMASGRTIFIWWISIETSNWKCLWDIRTNCGRHISKMRGLSTIYEYCVCVLRALGGQLSFWFVFCRSGFDFGIFDIRYAICIHSKAIILHTHIVRMMWSLRLIAGSLNRNQYGFYGVSHCRISGTFSTFDSIHRPDAPPRKLRRRVDLIYKMNVSSP